MMVFLKIEGKITRPNFLSDKFFNFIRKLFALTILRVELDIFILVRPESFSSRVNF
jgi:hypothetical protein